MSTPRAIRTRNVVVLRYLMLMTRVFGAATLGVLIFGIVLAQELKDLSKAWLTASMTLYVVALVLLLLIMRDQRRAVAALVATGKQEAPASQPPAGGNPEDAEPPAGESASPAQPAAPGVATAPHIANVERGRIASMTGVVSLIWLAILVLMVWNS
jgi:hypothetical protein